MILDGVIAGAAALAAAALCPGVTAYLLAGHRSTEPGATAALATLRLEPILDLGMRPGEGSGGGYRAGRPSGRGCCVRWPRSTRPGSPVARTIPAGAGWLR